MTLDLRAVEAEIAQYVAAGGRWLLVTERLPELLAHCRALRASLIESLGMSATNKLFPEIQKRAAAVLAQATDKGEA